MPSGPDKLPENRAMLAAIVESSDDAIIGKSLDGVIWSWNQAAERIYGYTAEEAIGRNISILAPPGHPDEIPHILESIMHGEYVHHYETERRGKDGKIAQVSLSVSPIKDEAGRIIGAATIARDISERKQAENELRRFNETLEQRVQQRTLELENAVRELEAFSYTVAHDLRSPLRAMNGFSQYLLGHYRDQLDERGRDYLTRIRMAAQRLGRLIDDLLDLTRLSRIPMNVEEVNLSALAREAIEALRRRNPQRRVTVEIAPGLTARGDRGMLRMALGHLLDNAWKFTGKREEARIAVGSIDQAGEGVYYVRDNGAGFDVTYMNKLYQPFQRLHTEEEFTGAGMGLALAQRIIQRHGGRIWAESSEGEGATFYFTLGNGRR